MPDIRKANFLHDEASQILALSDALASTHGPTISAAFDEVARTRGLAQIANDAGITMESLCTALADPARLDRNLLENVLSSLIRCSPSLSA